MLRVFLFSVVGGQLLVATSVGSRQTPVGVGGSLE